MRKRKKTRSRGRGKESIKVDMAKGKRTERNRKVIEGTER